MTYRFIFFFEWYYLLLFKELVYAALVNFSNTTSKSFHFFLWTDNIYRPLWTYEFSKNENQVIMTYGGGALAELKVKNTILNPDYLGLRFSTWDRHVVLDKSTVTLLKNKMTIPFDFKIQYPLLFYKLSKKLDLPQRSIAVFAYEDPRKYLGYGSFSDYSFSNGHYRLSGKLIFDFYNNLINLLKKKNFYLVTKRKRSSNNLFARSTDLLFRNLSKEKNFIKLDSSVNPIDLITSCKACISMPVTSTAEIARLKSLPSIFYDPYNWIDKNDSSLGKNLVLNTYEVDKWLDTIKI